MRLINLELVRQDPTLMQVLVERYDGFCKPHSAGGNRGCVNATCYSLKHSRSVHGQAQ